MNYEGEVKATLISIPEQLLQIIGVVYSHHRTSDGGDIYLTQFGMPFSRLLEIDNWYEKQWFEGHREKLEGTSAVYKVRTKELDGHSLDLVVKNSRFGEDVPLDTRTLMEFINAEFNSPWEEFSMVFELRESKFGPEDLNIKTQFPMAIYVPPETMQLWQSGRSAYKVSRIKDRHPGIDIDILKQYKLIYGWIKGKNIVEILSSIGIAGAELDMNLAPLTRKVIADMDKKGYAVADMKPSHIIIDENDIKMLDGLDNNKKIAFMLDLIDRGEYSIVDYELLIRTPAYDEFVKNIRRHSYLDDQRDRFNASPLPSYLSEIEIFDVPYIYGHVESTGGLLWVVGRNPNLYDYFLPERWRTTHNWKLSEKNDVYYTITKDNIHIVWKASRVGERPVSPLKAEYGYNSPFEEFSIADYLNNNGVLTVYMRAIYMTGSAMQERLEDMRRYETHGRLKCPDGRPVLSALHNYITIRGYYNGPDQWVAEQKGQLYRPVDLMKSMNNGVFTEAEMNEHIERVISKLKNIGYDGTLLRPDDIIITYDTKGDIIMDSEDHPELRITNLEFIRKL